MNRLKELIDELNQIADKSFSDSQLILDELGPLQTDNKMTSEGKERIDKIFARYQECMKPSYLIFEALKNISAKHILSLESRIQARKEKKDMN